MKPFYILCGVLTLVLTGLTFYYRAEPDTFYGIADTKEIVISSESPVEIHRILVEQGQLVRRGDTLLELHNPELELRISQISHELSELRSRKTAHATLSKSEILQLKAQQEERASEIRSEIRELEAQYNLNRQLVSELRSLDKDKAGTPGEAETHNPILTKLESLRKLLDLVQDPSRVYENRLANALSSDGDPLAEKVSQLEDELRILNEDRKRLIVPARISGLVGSVNFKVGEKVSPFAPILTVHAASPSFVRGYIHEDVYSQVALSQKVQVQSSQDRKNRVEAEVVGVGARIVEYPERLRKRADILIWGREIIIRLPSENRFLLGEKVLISLPGERSFPGTRKEPKASMEAPVPGTEAVRKTSAGTAEPPEAAKDIQAPRTAAASLAGAGSDLPGIEASGLLFLPDIGRFMVISDDTEKKQAQVFLMDTTLNIVKTVAIRGLGKMDDMEAISAGNGGSVYLLSSQSRTKGGKLPENRKLLVRARRTGEDLALERKVALLDLLGKAALENPTEPWSGFISKGITEGSIDIEGMAVREGDVYLGFKNPLLDGKAVVLRMAEVDSVLGGRFPGKGDISLWKALDLKGGPAGTACGISDLQFVEGDAYLLSTGTAGKQQDPGKQQGRQEKDGRHVGELWVLRKDSDRAERVKDFEGAKPEGLAYHAGSRSFFIAFDNGSGRPSQIQRLPR